MNCYFFVAVVCIGSLLLVFEYSNICCPIPCCYCGIIYAVCYYIFLLIAQDTGSSPYTECNKLLKDLQRGRNKNESIQISFFQVPVDEHALADYSVYVRNPTDLSTIKYRLDGSLPGTAQVAAAIGKPYTVHIILTNIALQRSRILIVSCSCKQIFLHFRKTI